MIKLAKKTPLTKIAKQLKYAVLVYWSEEDKVFIAEVPDLPGCMTHGSTYAKAMEMAIDAMSGWISVAEEDGDDWPEPTSRDDIQFAIK